MTILYKLLAYILFGKGGAVMMAMLWAQKIILGKKQYTDVPRLLKEQVKEILIESGLESLVVEDAE